MKYKNNYFSKELRQSYIENRISIGNGLLFGAFIALFTFFIHSAVMKLDGTVFEETYPYLIQESFFSGIYIYVKTAVLFCILYYIVFAENISLSEIRSNRWYLLAKMGYKPKIMILVKITTQFLSLTFTYLAGFIVALCLSFFAENTFGYECLPSLFLSGLVEIAFLCSLGTALSLFLRFKTVIYLKCIILLSEAALFVIAVFTGYHAALSSESFIAENGSFSPFYVSTSIYFILLIVFIIIFISISIYKAKDIAMYYDEPLENTDFTLPAGRALARLDHRTGNFYIFRKNKIKIRSVVFDTLFIALTSAILFAAFAFNVFVYYQRTDKIMNINGYFPYMLSDSNVKTDDNFENDLLIFKAENENESIDENSVIFAQKENIIIIDKASNQTDRIGLKGVLYSHSRWLGSAVILANTEEGRIFFIVVPLLILFMYKRVKRIFKKKTVPLE